LFLLLLTHKGLNAHSALTRELLQVEKGMPVVSSEEE
jgi:hypothetical protein